MMNRTILKKLDEKMVKVLNENGKLMMVKAGMLGFTEGVVDGLTINGLVVVGVMTVLVAKGYKINIIKP